MPSPAGTGPRIAAALGAGFLAVVSLVLPWFDILGRQRSSIDIVRSASALDVLEGGALVAVLAGWLLAPILVSIALFAGAAGRHRLAAGLLTPVGVALLAQHVGSHLRADQDEFLQCLQSPQ